MAGQRVRHGAVVVASYVALYLVFFSPALLHGQLLGGGDTLRQNIPAFFARWRLWDNTIYAGFPAAASTTFQTWYPLRWILGGLGAWNAYVIAVYVLASSFTYGYVHSLTRSVLAAAWAGIAFGLSGFMMAHLAHTAMIHAAAWLPLLLWALEEMRRRLAPAWLAIAALALALLSVAGHPQIFVNGILVAGFYVLFMGWSAASGRFRYYGLAIVALVCGCGLSAIQLVPTAELVDHGLRQTFGFEQFIVAALPPSHTPLLVFPYLFGSHPWPFTGTAYFGAWNLTEISGYLGLVTWIVAACGVWSRRRDPVARFWLVVLVAGILLALGDATPLARLAFLIPVVNRLRCLARHFLEVSLALAVLAGFGIAALERKELSLRKLAVLVGGGTLLVVGALVALALGLVAAQVLARAPGGSPSLIPWENRAIGVPLIVWVAGAGVLLWWRANPARPARRALLLGVLVIDLGSFGWFAEWRNSPHANMLDEPRAVAAAREVLAGTDQRLAWLGRLHYPVSPNLNRVWDLPIVNGYDAMVLLEYEQLVTLMDDGVLDAKWLHRPQDRTLDLLATRIVAVTKDSAGAYADLVTRPGWRVIGELPPLTLYENPTALPRAWMVWRIERPASPADILRAIHLGRLADGSPFDPRETALVLEDVPAAVGPADPGAQVTLSSVEDTRIALATSSASPGLVVTADVSYPGWEVTIDGEAATPVRADWILRGVTVPAGSHVVEWRYRPRSLVVGAVVSGASMAGLTAIVLVLFVWRSRARRRSPPA